MNVVSLMGRLTRDPDVRQGETCVAKYTLAVDRKKEGTDFINCVSFGKRAEFVEKYLKKGTKVVAVGRIKTGSNTNREGQKIYTTDVVVEDLEFAESKKTAAEPPDFVGVPDDMEGLPFN